MIKLIGARRALLLGALLALNLLIAAVYLLVVDPMREAEEASLRAANTRISQLSSDTQNIKTELATFAANYAKYQDLGRAGFFDAQDRFEAGRVLDSLRERAGLLGYSYKIDAIRNVPDALADAGDVSLIDSRITLENVSSVLDSNVYALLGSLASGFPQHTRIQKLEVKKLKELDEAALHAVASAPTALTGATVAFDWLTVVPKGATPGAAPPGGFRGR